ncbi:MAG: hypothetical protein IJW43_04755 [Clostridia bacterium]|nr:hypothetical protein [Clostridia bacterium]
MWEYVVSVGSTVLFISIITLILPSGKIFNFISYILSILLIFSVIKPIFNLNIEDLNLSNNANFSIVLDEEYVDYTMYLRAEEKSKECMEILLNENIKADKIEIVYDSANIQDFSIKNVKVFLSSEVIYPNDSNIDIIVRIKTLLSKLLGVSEGVIKIIE